MAIEDYAEKKKKTLTKTFSTNSHDQALKTQSLLKAPKNERVGWSAPKKMTGDTGLPSEDELVSYRLLCIEHG